jgi:hypothetical protein
VAVEGREPIGQWCVAQLAVLPEVRAAPVPDRDLGDVLVRQEQVTEHRPMCAVERATQVRPVDVLRGLEGPGRAVRMVKPVKKLEQQAGVLGVKCV